MPPNEHLRERLRRGDQDAARLIAAADSQIVELVREVDPKIRRHDGRWQARHDACIAAVHDLEQLLRLAGSKIPNDKLQHLAVILDDNTLSDECEHDDGERKAGTDEVWERGLISCENVRQLASAELHRREGAAQE